jgi:integrase/recombinase XerD
MKKSRRSPLAKEIEGFLKWKRTRGYAYRRAEFTLGVFDRYFCQQIREKKYLRLDQAMLAWLARLPDRKAYTVAQEMAILRQFWDYLRRQHPRRFRRGIHWPILPAKSDFTPYVFAMDEVKLLLRQIEQREYSVDSPVLLRTVFLVLYCTGLRFGELTRLKFRDVNLKRQTLFIVDSKGRSRWVPFHRSLGRELAKYLKERKRNGRKDFIPDDSFFVRSSERPLSVAWISERVRELLREVDLKPESGRFGPRPYDLRHTFAVHRLTRWYRQKIELDERLAWLSAYMGHVNLAGTETYLTATPELMALASNRFRRRFNVDKRANDETATE